MKVMDKSVRIMIATIGLCALGGYANAQTWTGGTGNWSVPENWNTNAVPNGGTVTVGDGIATINTSVPDVTRLNVGGAVSAEVIVATGGSLTVTGSNLLRVSPFTNDIGILTVDGGFIQSFDGTSYRAAYLGVQNNTHATLNIKNNGVLAANTLYATLPGYSGMTAIINMGGAGVAEAPGWLNVMSVSASQPTDPEGAANVAVFNLNHNSSRYWMTRTSVSSTGVALNGTLSVNAKAGVTVMTAASNFSQGTNIQSGAVILANNTNSSTTTSSLGSGSVHVHTGGTVGGNGFILGDVTVAGKIQSGDYAYGATTPDFGILTLGGNLELQSGSTTEFAINGLVRDTSYTGINVAGNLSLGGTLTVNLQNDLTLTEGNYVFNLFDVNGNISNSFDAYLLPETWDALALQWDTSQVGVNGNLLLNVIPEPATFLFLGLAALGATIHHRKSGASLK